MKEFLVVMLVLNLAGTVIYAVGKAVRREGVGVAVFFLFLPVLGFAVYFLPPLLQRLSGEEKYDRDSLIRRNRIKRMAEHPNLEEELNVVPVEDAMAINENREKRALLLRQLKKDINQNYRVLLAAENDEDSESVHYVAAAKMEVYRSLHRQWAKSGRVYEEDRAGSGNYRKACDALRKLIDSQVLSGREEEMYRKKYCSLLEIQERIDESVISGEDYEGYLACLIGLGRLEEAERLWYGKRDKVKSEYGYMKMAEMFYGQKAKAKFRGCIAELQKDRQVRLSAQGLERLRYWMQRE